MMGNISMEEFSAGKYEVEGSSLWESLKGWWKLKDIKFSHYNNLFEGSLSDKYKLKERYLS
jgi:hypothetical protein